MTREPLLSQLRSLMPGSRSPSQTDPECPDVPPAAEPTNEDVRGDRDQTIARYLDDLKRLPICQETVRQLAMIVAANDLATVLIGFNDYSKHLINLFPDLIVAVIDDHYAGIDFRDVPVQSTSQPLPDCKRLLVCDYDKIIESRRHYSDEIKPGKLVLSFASSYEGRSTRKLDIVRHDPLLREVFSTRHRRPSSMMGEAGASQILEQLRACLMLEGDVADIGAWQGGSAWWMAKYMSLLGVQKRLFVFDYGEQQPREKPQSIVCEEQMKRDLAEFS